ncbi:TIGR00296 family protein [Candidatus Bathyarchaeota archaeon]|nr:MAG: TIGR00296 family protein [Candidatus Bathyarchaeota archaeon]
MNLLSTEEGRILVGTARQAITHHLDGKNFDPADRVNSELSVPRGVFVTLFDHMMSRGLRGCIGNPFPKTSLLNETVRCAVEAATMDPRFAPLRQDEFLRSIALEVTVLSPLEHITVKSPLDFPLNIKVGRDGLLVDGVGTRGLLLPQVAIDEGFDEEEFLNQCCLKAGLMPDAWVTGSVKVARFQGQIFSEDAPGGRVFERKLKGIGRKG